MLFLLDSRLAADTFEVGEFALSRVLLMNDARFPWLILVPRRADIREICELGRADRTILIEEIAEAGDALRALPDVEKINVGALGNIVPQLHVHVVGRKTSDAAWPGAVWGSKPVRPYDLAESDALLAKLRGSLKMKSL